MLFFLNRKIGFTFSLLMIFSPHVYASFLYNELQSVSSMGNAFAGAGAAGDDATISFYNPAGLILIEDTQAVVSGTYAIPHINLTVDEATDSSGNPVPNSAGAQYSAVPDEAIPSVHAAIPLSEDLVLGMNVTAPYGGITNYPSDSVVKSTAGESYIFTYTGNLSLAMQVTEKLTLGAGGNLQYLKMKGDATIYNLTSTNEFFANYSGDDVAFYPNFGLLYEMSEATRLGLNYRMQVDHHVEGEMDFVLKTQSGDIMVPIPSDTKVSLPNILSANLFHQLNNKVELLADVVFTNWSRFGSIDIIEQSATGGVEIITVDFGLKNTWRAGIGANYYYTPEIKLRTGIAYDQSPVTDETRTLQAPDSDAIQLAVGAMIKPKSWKNIHLDVAYMHSFYMSGDVNQDNPLAHVPLFAPTPGKTASGNFNSSADFVGVQLVYSMGDS